MSILITNYASWHLGGEGLHTPLIHCKYGFPIITYPLSHMNKATSPFEMINTLPLTGSLSAGHFSVRK